jgi:hypothetical protein
MGEIEGRVEGLKIKPAPTVTSKPYRP